MRNINQIVQYPFPFFAGTEIQGFSTVTFTFSSFENNTLFYAQGIIYQIRSLNSDDVAFSDRLSSQKGHAILTGFINPSPFYGGTLNQIFRGSVTVTVASSLRLVYECPIVNSFIFNSFGLLSSRQICSIAPSSTIMFSQNSQTRMLLNQSSFYKSTPDFNLIFNWPHTNYYQETRMAVSFSFGGLISQYLMLILGVFYLLEIAYLIIRTAFDKVYQFTIHKKKIFGIENKT